MNSKFVLLWKKMLRCRTYVHWSLPGGEGFYFPWPRIDSSSRYTY